MNKRTFLKKTATASTGITIAPALLFSSCKTENKKDNKTESTVPAATATAFELPEIPYGYSAFTDTIDAMTMEIHHSKHHQGYTNKLNAALAEQGITGKTIEEILSMPDLPTAIRNNGGGYYNHTLYWDILTPGGSMSKDFEAKIVENFDSKEAFFNQLADAGAKRFGSGWAWVCQDNDKKLHICSTPNQDNPLMQVSERMGTPILGIDVWEHAYYLKYQNKRTDYLKNIIQIINWNKVEARMS